MRRGLLTARLGGLICRIHNYYLSYIGVVT
jgi:hypothetical protein